MPRMLTSISRIFARAYTVPTDAPEADGTFARTSTTIVVFHVAAGGCEGLGYTYSDVTNATFINDTLEPILTDRDAFDIPGALQAMRRRVRNVGRAGLAATAISAVDAALWDLKDRFLDVPLAKLLGCVRTSVPNYGSGGFTSYDDSRLCDQLADWVEKEGCRWVKMKVGTDPERVRAARSAIGEAALFVDANGGFVAEAGPCIWSVLLRRRGPIIRGTGLQRRSARRASAARYNARPDRGRRRRVCLYPGRYPRDARSGRRRCAAGRRDTVWRDQRVSRRRRIVRGAPHRSFSPLRTVAAYARRMRGPGVPPSGIFPRSCPNRCCSMVRCELETVSIQPDLGRPGMGLELKTADAERYSA